MQIEFYKYHGTGNDFIIIDQRSQRFLDISDQEKIAFLCDRHFGIGADGLMLLQEAAGYDFEMVYFNADGRQSSMCGNGGRCIVAFAHFLGQIGQQCSFLAIDGPHEAEILPNAWIRLKMSDVGGIQENNGYYWLDTGSPHYVSFWDSIDDLEIVAAGRRIRYDERFSPGGTNVNFVAVKADGLEVATYERGVEDETLSCGTGVTAAAIAYKAYSGKQDLEEVAIKTKGGQLRVEFRSAGDGYTDIWLSGPAQQVFKGKIELS